MTPPPTPPAPVVHTHPVRCFQTFRVSPPDMVTCSTDLNEVTCPQCLYFTYHPEARALNALTPPEEPTR